MQTLAGRAGEQQVPDSQQDVPVRVSSMAEQVTAEIHGKHYENALRGRIFNYGVASQALVLAAAGGGHPTIWNPAGSGFLFIPLQVDLSFISGTTVISGVNWMLTTNAGSQVSSAASSGAIRTFTTVQPLPGFIQNAAGGVGVPTGPRGSQMLYSPTTNTFLAAPVFYSSLGINLGAAAPTGSGAYSWTNNGKMIMGANNALSLCCTVTTTTALFAITIWGLELPVPRTN